MLFSNRRAAGIQLASALLPISPLHPVVLGLPRGGVPVAAPVAEALHAPLSVVVVRKLGAPGQKELAIGAISEEQVMVLDLETIQRLGVSKSQVRNLIANEAAELTRRISLYRGEKILPSFQGKSVIVIDDGLATGSTALAAVACVRKHTPDRIIFATPVCAQDSLERLKNHVEIMVCLITPSQMGSVGQWYQEFPQTSDEEVLKILENTTLPSIISTATDRRESPRK